MRQIERGGIPVQCQRCGAIFDLSYDLEGFSEEHPMAELLQLKHKKKNLLCWKCRQSK